MGHFDDDEFVSFQSTKADKAAKIQATLLAQKDAKIKLCQPRWFLSTESADMLTHDELAVGAAGAGAAAAVVGGGGANQVGNATDVDQARARCEYHLMHHDVASAVEDATSILVPAQGSLRGSSLMTAEHADLLARVFIAAHRPACAISALRGGMRRLNGTATSLFELWRLLARATLQRIVLANEGGTEPVHVQCPVTDVTGAVAGLPMAVDMVAELDLVPVFFGCSCCVPDGPSMSLPSPSVSDLTRSTMYGGQRLTCRLLALMVFV